jgi:hypothetical protein
MFPAFKEKLHTQPDKSLGFEHKIPAAGYQLYEGEGRMKGGLTMNNRGLRGTGTINFLAASVTANDFVFYPDSVIAKGTDARLEKKQFGDVTFPQALLTDFELKWLPKKDEMRIKNVKAPFSFYDSSAQMQGTIVVSKTGVTGIGKLETRGTELISRRLTFQGTNFSARRARFRVKSDDPTKPLLQGNDVKLKFDLEQNYADISPEVEGEAAIDFPFAQFKTSIPKMRWDLDEQKITMSKDPDVPLESSYFYTTRKELDSLNFNAESAEYNLKTQELKVSGIPYIIVADAKITPCRLQQARLPAAGLGGGEGGEPALRGQLVEHPRGDLHVGSDLVPGRLRLGEGGSRPLQLLLPPPALLAQLAHRRPHQPPAAGADLLLVQAGMGGLG